MGETFYKEWTQNFLLQYLGFFFRFLYCFCFSLFVCLFVLLATEIAWLLLAKPFVFQLLSIENLALFINRITI